jgi:hypothetical protein
MSYIEECEGEQATEKELREEVARLERVLLAGEATSAQANRVHALRRCLRRIDNVNYDGVW